MSTGYYKLLHLRDISYFPINIGEVVRGREVPGIFADRPFLEVLDDNGEVIAAAHLSRFEKVQNND